MKRLVLWAAVAATAQARADVVAIVGGSPRAIGRAGAAVVGDDGGGALLINPAAIARRDTTRVQLGVAVVEDDVRWQTSAQGAPLSHGQAGSRLAPLGAGVSAIGDWIVSVGAMTAAVTERALARPGDATGELGASYDYRYAGIAGGYRRDTLAIGVARRIGDSLALGLAFGASRVHVREHRRIWAGLGGVVGDPRSDVDLLFTARDRFNESAVAGLMYAPEDSPIELGASIGWARSVHLAGSVAAESNPPAGPSLALASPGATLEVRQPITVRAGGRYVGDRVVAELDGDLWIAPPRSTSAAWQVHGVTIVDPEDIAVELSRVPSRIAQHTHVALRLAIDVELIPGFLWATSGYALSTLGTPAARLSPSFGDLGGQTLGLGLETATSGYTVTLGWSRTWSLTTAAPTALSLDNPFMGPGGPAYAGTYDGSLDQIGLLLEIELSRAEH